MRSGCFGIRIDDALGICLGFIERILLQFERRQKQLRVIGGAVRRQRTLSTRLGVQQFATAHEDSRQPNKRIDELWRLLKDLAIL